MPALGEPVGQTRDERTFGADHREVDAFALDEREHAGGIVGRDPDALGVPRDPRVARRGEQLLYRRVASEAPRECVLAPAGAHHEDPHPPGVGAPGPLAVRLCSRPGPTDTTPIATPTSSSSRSRYVRAAAGRSPNAVAPPISSCQPSSSS